MTCAEYPLGWKNLEGKWSDQQGRVRENDEGGGEGVYIHNRRGSESGPSRKEKRDEYIVTDSGGRWTNESTL